MRPTTRGSICLFLLLACTTGLHAQTFTGGIRGVVRDPNGVVWYVRNGEVLRVGNKSQGFAVAVADLLLAHNADIAKAVELATRVAHEAVADPEVAEYVLEEPEVVGIEKVGPEGVTFRVTARTAPGQQFGVQRALITALTEAFDRAGLPRPLAFPTAAPPPTK